MTSGPEATSGMYAHDMSQAEMLRLRGVMSVAPNNVSGPIVEEFGMIEGDTLLDIGAGPAPFVRGMVPEGSMYIPMDLTDRALQGHRAVFEKSNTSGHHNLVQAEALALPFADAQSDQGGIDYSHMRFVFEHLPEDRRHEAVAEMMRVTRKEGAILVHQWDTLGTDDPQYASMISEAKWLFGQYGEVHNIDSYPQDELQFAVTNQAEQIDGCEVTFDDFRREDGNYKDELLGLLVMMAQTNPDAVEQMYPGFKDELEAMIKSVQTEEEVIFTPPYIFAARFKKS